MDKYRDQITGEIIEHHDQPCGCPLCATLSERVLESSEVPMERRVIVYSTDKKTAYIFDVNNIRSAMDANQLRFDP